MTASDKNMKRVGLGVLAGLEPGNYSLTTTSIAVTFIYGTSSGGLTPLERAIADMELGRSKEVVLAGEEIRQFFGCHISHFEEGILPPVMPGQLYLRLTLKHCDEADPRDVVKAISQSLTGGCNTGDCGCGCG